jgi:uncharacterized protein (TIGR00369 family)
VSSEVVDSAPRKPGLGCAFFDQLDFDYVETEQEGASAVELRLTDDLRGPGGSLHGGLVAMLVDVAGAYCLAATSGRLVATAGASIEYLAAGRVGPIRASAMPLRISDTRGVAEVRVIDVGRDGRLMASAFVTVSFLAGDAFVPKTT